MSSDRPFACTVCSQTFTRNENLERHKRSRHEGNTHKPYECIRCQTRFSRRDVCKRHVERCRGRGDLRQRLSNDHQNEPLQLDLASSEDSPSMTIPPVTYEIEGLNLMDTWPRTEVQNLSPSIETSQSSTQIYIAAYFEYFHPSLPLLHRPTITKGFNEGYPEALRSIIIAIGSLYTAQTLTGEDASSSVQWSHSLWETGRKELSGLSSFDWTDQRRTWTLQAWLLHIIYGAFMGDSAQYGEAKNMLRSLMDATRDLGLLRQAVATSNTQSWTQACNDASVSSDANTLHDRWMMYVNEESMKLAMHTLLFLDFHISYPCNNRCLTSTLDFDWELPFSSSLWESENAIVWLERLRKEPRILALLEPDESLDLPCPTMKCLTLAMQSLMSDSPSPYLLAALSASPVSILFLLTNIDSLCRDLTRSYYQLPPALSDPSTFHIFTQNQNRLFNAALQNLSRVLMEGERAMNESSRTLWTTLQRLVLTVKISLYKPDDLLIGGIVDSSVIAGLATAVHLTLGRYTGSRRSIVSMLYHNSGDDLILSILEECIDVLQSISLGSQADALREAPWATVACNRIFLTLWRSLRWAAAEMRRRLPGSTQGRKIFDTPVVIYNVIMQAISQLGGQGVTMSYPGMLETSPEGSEVAFTKAMLHFWKQRSVWAMGPAMVTILEEIIASGL